MANLSESPDWVAGIYQFEESDPVQGGAEGIDNLQAKQLANRTSYLKQLVEAAGNNMTAHLAAADPHAQYATELWVAAQIAALLDSAPGALDTLNELAAALGDDPNFAATLTTLLAAKAPLASPALTGSPTAPTAAQFDNDTSLATTAFVQRALGNYQTGTGIAAPATLTPAQAGGVYEITVAGAIMLPTLASVLPGASYQLVNYSGSACTVQRQGADPLYVGGASMAAFTIASGDTATIVNLGVGLWASLNGNANLAGSPLLAASLSGNGYQKLPNGLIIQWGAYAVSPAPAYTDINWPIAFPGGVFAIASANTIAQTAANLGYNLGIGTLTLTGTRLYNNGSGGALTASIIVIGK